MQICVNQCKLVQICANMCNFVQISAISNKSVQINVKWWKSFQIAHMCANKCKSVHIDEYSLLPHNTTYCNILQPVTSLVHISTAYSIQYICTDFEPIFKDYKDLQGCAQICINIHQCAPICMNLYGFVLTYMTLHPFVPIWTDLHQFLYFAMIGIDLHRFELTIIDL